MKTTRFKTNVMCGACLEKIGPVMNETVGAGNWAVDITNPSKILTVNSETLPANEVIKAVAKAGYKAEEIRQGN